jgi:hypothetical protein
MANGYRLVHDPADPRCMIENAMGWEHDSRHDGEIQLTPEQEETWDRATYLYSDICCNHNEGKAARNDVERRIYAELDLDAADRENDALLAQQEAYAEEVDAYNRGGLQAVSPEWLKTPDGREFLAEDRAADRAEFAADREAGA